MNGKDKQRLYKTETEAGRCTGNCAKMDKELAEEDLRNARGENSKDQCTWRRCEERVQEGEDGNDGKMA